MKSRWRAGAFAAVAVISAVAGLLWHAGADRPTKLDASPQPPLRLGIYESDHKVPLDVHLDITSQGPGWQVQVLLTFEARRPTPVNLILTSNTPPNPDARPIQLPTGHGGTAADRYLVPVFDGDQDDDAAFVNVPVATFTLSRDDVSRTSDVIKAQLPSIATGEDNSLSQPLFGLIGTAGARTEPDGEHLFGRSQMQWDAASSFDGSDLDWDLTGGRPFAVRYFQPQHLTTTETLAGLGDQLSDSDIRVDIPSNGLIDSAGFIWQGSYGLSPRLLAVSRSSEDRQDQEEFLSGIALATAAAATVALIQEGSDTWSWRRRRQVVVTYRGPRAKSRRRGR